MSWQPSASIEVLKARANLNAFVREFFALRDVMEVETPLLSHAAVSDVHLQPVVVQCCGGPMFLHTSPEYPMKRLLAAGSGDIYQICKVFRDHEHGGRHNPEFTMLEYYRLGFSLETLMDEVAELVGNLLNIQVRYTFSYREVFQRYLGIDPFTESSETLLRLAQSHMNTDIDLTRDACLDVLMTHGIEPQLPENALVFISAYPGSQAALANTYESADGYSVAKRFELYVNGIELANGYDELVDVEEQKQRFANDSAQNQRTFPQDQHFINALQAGLPPCSGVAIGIDRVLMLQQTLARIDQVLSFSIDNA